MTRKLPAFSRLLRGLSSSTRVGLQISVALLSACSAIPEGPSQMALPGQGQAYAQFQRDEQNCRLEARQMSGGVTPTEAQQQSLATGALTGTALGAASGAALTNGEGTAAGAGAGLLGGASVGNGQAEQSQSSAQRRYDQVYLQCMYGHGHRIPLNGRVVDLPTRGPEDYSPSRSLPLPPRTETEASMALPPR